MSKRLPEMTNDLPKKYKKKRYYVFGRGSNKPYCRKMYSDRTYSNKDFVLPLDNKNNK